eukprot:g2959.t1
MVVAADERKRGPIRVGALAPALCGLPTSGEEKQRGGGGAAGAPPARAPPPILKMRYFSLHHVLMNWMSPLMALGNQRTLVDGDLPDLAPQDASAHLRAQLDAAWRTERRRNPGAPSLARALRNMFAPGYLDAAPLLVTGAAVRISQTQCLALLIEHFEAPTASREGGVARGAALGAAVVSLQLAYGVLHHNYVIRVHRIGLRMRSACLSCLFAKILRVRSTGVHMLTHGHVTNLASTDIERFQYMAIVITWLFTSPLEACVCGVFLWREVGAAALAGCAAVLLLVPLQFWFSRLFARARRATTTAADGRVRVVSQVVTGVGQIKMSGWEAPFNAAVEKLRGKELAHVRKSSRLRASNQALFFIAATLVSFLTFAVYGGALGHVLTRRKIFTCMALFNLLQFGMGLVFAKAMEAVAECRVTIKRLQAFLELAEVPETPRLGADTGGAGTGTDTGTGADMGTGTGTGIVAAKGVRVGAVEAVGLRCRWAEPPEEQGSGGQAAASSAALPLAVRGLTFGVQPGQLFAVVGPVGCGKSALLLALLRELQPATGDATLQPGAPSAARAAAPAAPLRTRGRTALVAQEPFVLSATLRQNIVFTRADDDERFDEVAAACALLPDLQLLPAGDGTVIGERGINLSGGQRARVALARAAYARPDIVLLDDPLSAVDAHVARHLMDRCICDGPLRSATRVLVTHQTQFLDRADAVLVLGRDGRALAAPGPWADVRALAGQGAAAGPCGGGSGSGSEQGERGGSGTAATSSQARGAAAAAGAAAGGNTLQGAAGDAAEQNIVEEEVSEVGTVRWATYGAWVRAAGGWPIAAGTLLLMLLGQLLVLLSSWWLSEWAALPADAQSSRSGYYFGVFVAFVGSAAVVGFVRAFFFFHFAVSASRQLHSAMLRAVLRAPIAFFERNPMGRILNRFSGDVSKCDDLLPQTMYDFLQVFCIVVGAIAVACAASPWVLIVMPPLLAALLWLRRYFLASARELQRCESTSRSPVFALLAETFSGLATVRAFGVQGWAQREFGDRVDANMRAFWMWAGTTRWLAMRLELLTTTLIAATTFSAVAIKQLDGGLEPGLLALALVNIMQCAAIFQWMIRNSGEVETQMVSVERIAAYAQLSPQPEVHAPAVAAATAASAGKGAPPQQPPPPAGTWPARGGIVLRDLAVRHRDGLPLALRGVSCSIHAGANVGIIGRTGSGKSTLVKALLRLVDPAAGSVTLDGVDTGTVPLHVLRQRVSVLCQSPVLFSGPLRFNLDPLGLWQDAELLGALEKVRLRRKVLSLGGGLDAEVAEAGGNFSVGERQLLCMARALLPRNKVLLLDEATANVDAANDALIQATVRAEFKESTVLMVAHRLDTIIDCDRVLVLDKGRVAEFGVPARLLEHTGGHFARAVAETGPGRAAQLAEAARLASGTGGSFAVPPAASTDANVNATAYIDD